MFGPFGWAARELGNDRSDDGGRWLDRGRISPEQTLAGMKWVGPLSAGDVVIMPESTTHAALPWQPLDRARRIQVFRFIPQTRAGYANPPVRIWPALFCTCTIAAERDSRAVFVAQLETATLLDRLAPETRELIETVPGRRRKSIVEGAALPAWRRLSGQGSKL